VKGVDGKTFETINPATEEVICSVSEATEKDVDIAVAAARKAFETTWRKETPENRGKLLVNLANLIEKNADLLAAVESLDNGKAIGMAKVDVGMVAGCLRYYGGWADKIEGKVIDTNPDTFSYTRQEPVRNFMALDPNSILTVRRLAFAVKSSHGTSLCSCGHGRLVPPLLLVTPSLLRPLNRHPSLLSLPPT
jgi:acyl-CoA reductase-like NAD-dependent aldehyde dehydrogenase